MKIDEIIKEIQELKQKEQELEYLKKDKIKMADKLYEYELKKYENTTIDERKEKLNNPKNYDKYELLNELNNIGKEMYEIPLIKEYGELFRLYEKTYNTCLLASEKENRI